MPTGLAEGEAGDEEARPDEEAVLHRVRQPPVGPARVPDGREAPHQHRLHELPGAGGQVGDRHVVEGGDVQVRRLDVHVGVDETRHERPAGEVDLPVRAHRNGPVGDLLDPIPFDEHVMILAALCRLAVEEACIGEEGAGHDAVLPSVSGRGFRRAIRSGAAPSAQYTGARAPPVPPSRVLRRPPLTRCAISRSVRRNIFVSGTWRLADNCFIRRFRGWPICISRPDRRAAARCWPGSASGSRRWTSRWTRGQAPGRAARPLRRADGAGEGARGARSGRAGMLRSRWPGAGGRGGGYDRRRRSRGPRQAPRQRGRPGPAPAPFGTRSSGAVGGSRVASGSAPPIVPEVRLSRNRVWFRRLSETECRSYRETGEPADKAGSYALQGLAAAFVTRLEGELERGSRAAPPRNGGAVAPGPGCRSSSRGRRPRADSPPASPACCRGLRPACRRGPYSRKPLRHGVGDRLRYAGRGFACRGPGEPSGGLPARRDEGPPRASCRGSRGSRPRRLALHG